MVAGYYFQRPLLFSKICAQDWITFSDPFILRGGYKQKKSWFAALNP